MLVHLSAVPMARAGPTLSRGLPDKTLSASEGGHAHADQSYDPHAFEAIAHPFRDPQLATGKCGCAEVRVYPAECGEQLGRVPSKIGSSKSLLL